MKIAIVGCGWVADFYLTTLPGHPGLKVLGAYDRDAARLDACTRYHGIGAYPSLDALLGDPLVELVVNLTNPHSHFEITRAALLAGKHVYSEKPLAMTMAEAEEMMALARERGLGLAAAPCNHLSPPIQRMKEEMRAGRMGRILMAQAEMDDNLVPYLDHPRWRSLSGAPWPARDEFEVGCIMEHAGYQVGPLVELFGPVRHVTALPTTLMPEKAAMVGAGPTGPDFSTGILEFDEGVVARLNLSIVAPHNRLLRVVGTRGFATMSDVWDNRSRVTFSPTGSGRRERALRKLELKLGHWLPGILLGRRLSMPMWKRQPKAPGMDFASGIAQLAAQIEMGAPKRVGPELALHVTEVTLALQSLEQAGRRQEMRTSF
jgi:predicted dehydrogenase